jgi:putative aldouronate transport system substrate-binding protein
MLLYWGKEGVSYKIENGGPVYTAEQQAKFDELGWHGGWHGPSYFASGPELTYYDTNAVLNDMEFYQAPMTRNMQDVKLVIPELRFTDAEMEKRQKINSDIGGFFNEWATDFILGKRSLDADWDEYVDKMKDLGADEMEAIYNDAYDRYLQWQAKQ